MNHLDAQASLWSLRAARRHLDVLADASARHIALDAADGLRSPRYGGRGGGGGHSDPVTDVLITAVDRATRYADGLQRLADSTTATLRWLATRLRLPGGSDPLGRLEAALPALPVSTVTDLHRWIVDLDGRIRTELQLPPDDYGTAAMLAARLTTEARPIDAARIRDWARRSRTPGDPLHGMLPGVHTAGERTGHTWYRLNAARRVLDATKRQATQCLDEQVA